MMTKRIHLKKDKTKPRKQLATTDRRIGAFAELAPNQFIRTCDADLVFFLHSEHVPKLVKEKKLPEPVELYPGSRAVGWTSEIVNDYRRKIADSVVAREQRS
jgi:hypothetical protein